MRIPQKQQAIDQFQAAKSALKSASENPNNAPYFQVSGDRVELSQNVSFPLDGHKVVVKKGSHFDNDITTPDKVTLERQNGGTLETDTFEHFSEKRGLIFKRDQEMLTVTYAQSQGFNSSFQSATFEI